MTLRVPLWISRADAKFARPSARVRSKSPTTKACRNRRPRLLSMQHAVAALGETVMRGRFVEQRKLGFQMLVDEQQGPQRAAEIAATIGHDLVDGRVIGSET